LPTTPFIPTPRLLIFTNLSNHPNPHLFHNPPPTIRDARVHTVDFKKINIAELGKNCEPKFQVNTKIQMIRVSAAKVITEKK